MHDWVFCVLMDIIDLLATEVMQNQQITCFL